MTVSPVNNSLYAALQTGYLNAAANVSKSNSKYVPVDPKQYQGTWLGQNGDGSKIRIAITGVDGFKATVRMQNGNSVNLNQVLIKDSAFRLGDSKFVLTGTGMAQLATAVTDPLTGNVSLQQANLTQQNPPTDNALATSASGKTA